ncbi:MAG: ribonuclease Y [Ruminococcus sp.]|nr:MULTISPECIES: ribonuclease Y [Ruminococcus]MCI5598901.1 ribonuclease Y [Ruminococcus sp.]MCI5617564.1 ribonuclease Y [Ruminococcus sp.]MCI6506479.1 ribonuclease Y [Ruminococcus sp.]MDD5889777.1 ribonuclease Y [Ruminococcus sp.]MDD6532106.1 ribonuclease Y [Ruminococcus sp.]
MPMWLAIVLIVVAIVAGLAVGVYLGIQRRKQVAEKAIGSAEAEANRIVSEAIKSAEAKKKEFLLEGKDELHRLRNENEKEISDRRKEVQRQERRIQQKEETLDRKMDNLEKKENNYQRKQKEVEQKLQEVEQVKKSQFEMLERISGYTADQAKDYLLQQLDTELDHEKSVKILEYEEKLKEESDKRARNIISLAIQRLASDQVSEATVSVVPLPNDDMKGRIIGREGRNIRTIETLTGVDLIIDDTPEAITLSSFEPVRREIARVALEKLISDGRIHPARIEETVEKARREVEATIKAEGERTVVELGVNNLHPELVKLLGRLKYRTSYGQNVLRHSIEVAYISGMIASELGLNPTVAKRAGLLHDIGKALDHEMEGSHIQLGVEVARKYKESDAVIHAIHAHHGDVEAKTVVACIVQAADAISAARPGARRENIENYIKRLQQLEEVGKSFPGVDSCFAIQAGREIRVMVKPEQINDDKMAPLAREISKKIEQELEYPGQIKVNIIRESRVSDYAK